MFCGFKVDECLWHCVTSILDTTNELFSFSLYLSVNQKTLLKIETGETFIRSCVSNLWMLISLTCNNPCLSSLWKHKQSKLWLSHFIWISYKVVNDNYKKFIVMSIFEWIYGDSKNNNCFCAIGSMEDEGIFSTLAFMKDKLCNWLGPHLNLIVHMFAQSFSRRKTSLIMRPLQVGKNKKMQNGANT